VERSVASLADPEEESRVLVELQTVIEGASGLRPGELREHRPSKRAALARREFSIAAVRLAGVRAVRVARFVGVTSGRVSQYLDGTRTT